MDQHIVGFLLLFTGIIVSIGLVNLMLGLQKGGNKLYLYFGLIGLFSSGYYILSILNNGPNEYPLIFKSAILSLMVAFVALPWFLSSYSGYENKFLKLTTLVGMLISFGLLIFTASNQQPLYWNILAHLVIVVIIVYGFLSGRHLFKEGNKKSGWLIQIMMLITTVLTFDDISLVHFPEIYPSIFPEGFLPLDYFPILFMIVMGVKLASDIQQRYYLEKEYNASEKRWSSLLQSIELFVVGLDNEGRVNYANPYFLQKTGHSLENVIGMDWFDNFLPVGDQALVRIAHHDQLIKGKHAHYENPIRIKNGDQLIVSWSNVNQFDSSGNVIGVVSIGADITERKNAYFEIQQLKDELEKENILLRDEISKQVQETEVIGKSDTIKYAIHRALQVADTDSTVLLEGETGVGKEIFANLIHRHSSHKNKAFIKVNCSALSKELIESELFGHEKGAFTGALKSRQGRFELANKGTLFLDEIGELPLDLQPKILRVLQTGEFEPVGSEKTIKVDVRIVAATNRLLFDEVKNGNFREDLFYRLNVYPITIPPLRKRKEDIPQFVQHFVNSIGKKLGKQASKISKSDLKKLQEYNWPGNVRELENIIERALIVSNGETIHFEVPSNSPEKDMLQNTASETPGLKDFEKDHIIKTLEECAWKINGEGGAAEKLKMNPNTLRSRMKKLDIQRPE